MIPEITAGEGVGVELLRTLPFFIDNPDRLEFIESAAGRQRPDEMGTVPRRNSLHLSRRPFRRTASVI
jgi:hypothetical protein